MISRRQFASLSAYSMGLARRPAAAAAVRRLRLGIGSGLDNSFGAAATVLAREVGNRTGGRLVVDIYPNATLGNDEAMLAATRAGTLDMTAVSSALLAPFAPEIGVLDLPFLFEGRDHARAALDGPEGQALIAIGRAQGVGLLAWGENGVRHLTARKLVRSVSDIQGLKLRVLPSPILVNAFRAMGAAADTCPYSQLYEGLLTGRFEAQENPLQLILSGRFYEVQSYVTLTAHTYSAMAIVASPDLLEDLDPADQTALRQSALAAAAASREFAGRSDFTALDALRGKGMNIIIDPDRRSFQAAAAASEADDVAHFGADRLARLRHA